MSCNSLPWNQAAETDELKLAHSQRFNSCQIYSMGNTWAPGISAGHRGLSKNKLGKVLIMDLT